MLEGFRVIPWNTWGKLGTGILQEMRHLLCVSLCLSLIVCWLCIVFLSLQSSILRVCKWPIIRAPKRSTLVPETWRTRILLIYVWTLSVFAWSLVLQVANTQANARKWWDVLLLKTYQGTLAAALSLEGEEPGTQYPVFSCLSFSLCIYCTLSSLQTHSLLLRPLPAGPGFSVDPLCSHLVKLQHTWRLASEVAENCLLLKFLLKGLEITGNEERCLQSWEPVGTETLGHKGASVSARFARGICS